MWDLPGPGLEPVSPALAGGFLTTAPPGKPDPMILKYEIFFKRSQLPWIGGGGEELHAVTLTSALPQTFLRLF